MPIFLYFSWQQGCRETSISDFLNARVIMLSENNMSKKRSVRGDHSSPDKKFKDKSGTRTCTSKTWIKQLE
jgi:hypothetical protein